MTRFRNPFKRRKTVAEPIEEVRSIVQAFGTPRAYVSYEFEHDCPTDRSDWIILTHPFVPQFFHGRNEDFILSHAVLEGIDVGVL